MDRLDRAHRAIPAIIGAIALASVAVLFASDTFGICRQRAWVAIGSN
jgi:hypothetical protein